MESKLFYLQIVLISLVSTWGFGGRAEWGPPVIIALCWSTIIPYLMSQKSSKYRCLYFLIPLLILFIPIGFSLTNYAYIREGETYVANSFNPALPFTMEFFRTLENALLLSGVLWVATISSVFFSRKEYIRKFLIFLLINGLVITFLGIYFNLTNSSKIFGYFNSVNPQFFGSFYYHNHYNAYACILSGISLGMFFYSLKRFGPVFGRGNPALFYLFSSLFIATGVGLSSGRAGLIAIVFIFIFFINGIIRYIKQRSEKGKTHSNWGFIVFYIALSIGFFGFISYDVLERKWGDTKAEFSAFQSDKIDLTITRYYLYRDAIGYIKEKPLWGWGLGSYQFVHHLYCGKEFRDATGRIVSNAQFTHNDLLQYCIEIGILGFLCLAIIPVSALIYLRKKGKTNWIGYGLSSSIVGIAIISCFDFPLGSPGILFILSLIFALYVRYGLLENKS